MLKKKYRLKKYSAVMATYRVNNVISDKNVFIYLGKEKIDYSLPVKFAFIVSKKISKSAVKRNKIKRRMRESIRLLLKNSSIKNINKYISVVIVAKKHLLDSDFDSVYSSLSTLLSEKA